ncbi:MarR family transcriptional regulator [Curtobacterium sp. MCBD17_032]|uniref:MarR family transcriptional regulator n=1 Tax=Curtobacterium sp. MCBD17_032 TaxID=2175659 RepID=UPI0015E8EB75|nr:MarR family transcriptional regulator [Curtobacterium sp. MCBD17_032]
MTSEDNARNAHRVCAEKPSSQAGAAAIEALQSLSDSVHDADERALRALQMRPIDALALLHLVEASRGGRFLRPTELAVRLHLTTAGVTKLVDRLSRAERVDRRPNPRDRRSVALVPTATGTADLTRAYGHIHTPLITVINELSDAEATVVARFATRFAEALRQDSDQNEPFPAGLTEPLLRAGDSAVEGSSSNRGPANRPPPIPTP